MSSILESVRNTRNIHQLKKDIIRERDYNKKEVMKFPWKGSIDDRLRIDEIKTSIRHSKKATKCNRYLKIVGKYNNLKVVVKTRKINK